MIDYNNLSNAERKRLRDEFPKFECNPPTSCFNCPFLDCISPSNYINQAEVEYHKCAEFKTGKRKKIEY